MTTNTENIKTATVIAVLKAPGTVGFYVAASELGTFFVCHNDAHWTIETSPGLTVSPVFIENGHCDSCEIKGDIDTMRKTHKYLGYFNAIPVEKP